MSDKGTETRSAEERIADALEIIAEAHKPYGVPVDQDDVRDEWRYRFAGCALEGLLAALPRGQVEADPNSPMSRDFMRRSAALALMAADALLAKLEGK